MHLLIVIVLCTCEGVYCVGYTVTFGCVCSLQRASNSNINEREYLKCQVCRQKVSHCSGL